MEPNGPIDLFVPMSLIFIILAPGAVFVWLVLQVRHGLLTASKGTRCFLVYSLTPLLLYVAIGPLSRILERITDASLVGEAYRTSLFAVLGIGAANAMVLCGIFCMLARWYESRRRRYPPSDSSAP